MKKVVITVKEIPVPQWANEKAVAIIERFNQQGKKLKLDMYKQDITSFEDLEVELEQGYYDFIYPDCKEAKDLKEMIEDAEQYPRYLGFDVSDLDVEEDYVIVYLLSSDMVREVCIERNYYTKGDNEHYQTMLAKAHDRHYASGSILQDLAQDIKDHSDTPDRVKDIAQKLLENACTPVIHTVLEF